LRKQIPIILLKVSGTIDLVSKIGITDPFITIAGQTAPGDGICLKGGALNISTHDVIVRYLRIRPGVDREVSQFDCISIGSSSSGDIIIYHCSTSWSSDEG